MTGWKDSDLRIQMALGGFCLTLLDIFYCFLGLVSVQDSGILRRRDMRRYEWNNWTDPETAKRRAGGRKRYNAQRQRKAEQRREIISEWLNKNPMAFFFPRGVHGLLAPLFGVHPSTIWRDLQYIIFPPREYRLFCNGELVCTA